MVRVASIICNNLLSPVYPSNLNPLTGYLIGHKTENVYVNKSTNEERL